MVVNYKNEYDPKVIQLVHLQICTIFTNNDDNCLTSLYVSLTDSVS